MQGKNMSENFSRFLMLFIEDRDVTCLNKAPIFQTLLIFYSISLKPPEYFLASNRDDRDIRPAENILSQILR